MHEANICTLNVYMLQCYIIHRVDKVEGWKSYDARRPIAERFFCLRSNSCTSVSVRQSYRQIAQIE